MKAKKRTKNAEIPPATAWHPAARKLGEAVRFSFLRLYFHIVFFLQEVGRQNNLLVAFYEKKHLWKTRTGLLAAWEFAKVRCDIKFDTV